MIIVNYSQYVALVVDCLVNILFYIHIYLSFKYLIFNAYTLIRDTSK